MAAVENDLFSGGEIASLLEELGATHVVWLPDSVLGPWEEALERSNNLRLVRVCREGEAWPLAAGLWLGGKLPVVVMQTTGLFESGDALRNVLFDLGAPLVSIIGARSWLAEGSRDSARKFAEPVLKAWGLDYVIVESPADKPKLADHFRRCLAAGRPGTVLLAEGRM
jgi:sulfopyruvate decarboxylase subunit alpha